MNIARSVGRSAPDNRFREASWLSLARGAQLHALRVSSNSPGARWAEEASAEVVRGARLQGGERVVDIASGGGEPGLALALAGAQTTLLDSDDAALQVARSRARSLGLEIRTVHGSAEDIPLPTGCADVVTCQWGVHHFERPGLVLAEVARLLRRRADREPSGRFVALDWGRTDGTALHEATWKQLGVSAESGPSLAAIVAPHLQVTERRTARIVVRWAGSSADLVESIFRHTPQLVARIARVDEREAAATRSSAQRLLEVHRVAGVLELEARIEIVVAEGGDEEGEARLRS